MLLPVCLCPPQFMLFINRLSLSSSAAAATTATTAPPPAPSHGDGTQANTRHRLVISTFQNSKPSQRREEEDDMHKSCAATDTAALLLSILVDDLVSLCSFLATHPLHSAYLLFFLPYLAQLLSFLSPLLLSTSLLLLVLLTASSYYLDEPPPPAPPEFLGRTCRIVLGVLKDELHGSAGTDQLEEFASMFLSPIDDASPSARESAAEAVFGELFVDACSDHEEAEGAFEDAEEISQGETFLEADASAIDGGVERLVLPNSGTGGESAEMDNAKAMGAFEVAEGAFEDAEEIVQGETFLEADASTIEGGVERPVLPNSVTGGESAEMDNAKAMGAFEVAEGAFEDAEEIGQGETFLEADASAIDGGVESPVLPNSGIGGESAETDDAKAMEKVEEDPPRSKPGRIAHSSSESIDSLQRHGSAKKEKEWKRTLACKLYEERMTYKLCKERKAAEGDEEMDLLWEAYEANASEGDARKKKEEKKAKRIEHEEEEEEEEEEDEEATVGQLCCLQALKLSTGKMNLGMGKKNLMKISKALKGFKLFTRSSSKKK